METNLQVMISLKCRSRNMVLSVPKGQSLDRMSQARKTLKRTAMIRSRHHISQHIPNTRVSQKEGIVQCTSSRERHQKMRPKLRAFMNEEATRADRRAEIRTGSLLRDLIPQHRQKVTQSRSRHQSHTILPLQLLPLIRLRKAVSRLRRQVRNRHIK